MHIALFRGINVGGRNTLPMKDLVAILKSLGYEKIRTYIQSGNAVFSSRGRMTRSETDRIRQAILAKKGFEPDVFLLSAEQLRNAIRDNPFAAGDGKTVHVFFLDGKPQRPDLTRLDALRAESEAFKLCGSVFYLRAPNGLGRSKLAAAVEKSLGVRATARNWNTVVRLASMVENA